MKTTQYIPQIHKLTWFDNWTHGIYRTLSIEFHLQLYSVNPWYLKLMFDLVRKIAWAADLIDVFGRVGATTYSDLHSCIDISISARSVIHELISLFLLCIHLFCVIINIWDMAQVKIGLYPLTHPLIHHSNIILPLARMWHLFPLQTSSLYTNDLRREVGCVLMDLIVSCRTCFFFVKSRSLKNA